MAFKFDAGKLRELGFLEPGDVVDEVREGPWTRDGAYYVSIVSVALMDGRVREFVLKCPWDFTYDLVMDPSAGDRGSELITSHVAERAKWSKELREHALPAVKMEVYDSGTLIQENLMGVDLYTYTRRLSRAEAERYEGMSKEILKQIDSVLGLVHVDAVQIGDDESETMKDFVVTSDGRLVLVNLEFRRRDKN